MIEHVFIAENLQPYVFYGHSCDHRRRDELNKWGGDYTANHPIIAAEQERKSNGLLCVSILKRHTFCADWKQRVKWNGTNRPQRINHPEFNTRFVHQNDYGSVSHLPNLLKHIPHIRNTTDYCSVYTPPLWEQWCLAILAPQKNSNNVRTHNGHKFHGETRAIANNCSFSYYLLVVRCCRVRCVKC